MMHGDSRVMGTSLLATTSLPASCLSTSTSQDPAKNPLLAQADANARRICWDGPTTDWTDGLTTDGPTD